MLVFALAACAVQTMAILRFRDPQPTVTAGERVTLNGVGYTLDEFVVGPGLPAKPDQDPVTAPPGTALVGIAMTVVVDDPDRDTATLSCSLTLVDDRRRRWTVDYDVGYRATLPERSTCAGSKEYPVIPGRPYAVGAAFTVPADAADLRLRLELPTDRQVIEFHR